MRLELYGCESTGQDEGTLLCLSLLLPYFCPCGPGVFLWRWEIRSGQYHLINSFLECPFAEIMYNTNIAGILDYAIGPQQHKFNAKPYKS